MLAATLKILVKTQLSDKVQIRVQGKGRCFKANQSSVGDGKWRRLKQNRWSLASQCENGLMWDICGKFFSPILLALLVQAYTVPLTPGNPALNYHSSHDSCCFWFCFTLGNIMFGFMLPHAAGLDPANSWVLLAVQHLLSISQPQSRALSFVSPAIQGAYFKIDCTLFKRTLSEGNEAEQNVQEVNNSLEYNQT